MSQWPTDCESIRQTIALYCQLLDDNRFEELSRLFSVDAELPWEGRILRGRADIAANMQSTQQPKGTTRHLPFAPVIDIRAADGPGGRDARVWCDVIVTVHPPEGPAFIGWTGRYHDRYVVEDGEWGIHRHIAVENREPLPEGAAPPISAVSRPG